MDSDAARNNNPNSLNTEYDGDRTVSSSPATTKTATTISTIILQSHPVQFVVGLLQSKSTLNVKIVEISPKLNFLGATIEETVELQVEHDAVYKKLQNQKTPIDEFNVKAERMLAEKEAHPKLLEAMGQSLAVAWNDLLRIFDQRRHILNVNANFHEKIGICLGKMSALEVSCRETMLPNEIEAIQEFLNKFKQLRIEVLASVMVALKEGNELLALLRETAMGGRCDSRPDSIKIEIKKSISQVELWLEELHDRRNDLEQAWQKRKIQLEHCLAISMLIRDIYDLEQQLRIHKENFDIQNHKLDGEANISNALIKVIALKRDAVMIRDRALKITRSTEKLSSNNRFDGGSNKAYMFLHECTEFVEELDNYEELLNRIKEFFEKSDRTLTELHRLESETVNLFKDRSMESYSLTRLINDIAVLVDEPLRLGHALLDRIGRSNAQAFDIEKTVVEMENRRIYLEEFYTQNNFEHMRITETLNEFYELCKSISVWLISMNKTFLIKNNSMGNSLNEGKHFLQLHHQMLSDLEIKGTEINSLLINTSPILESIEQMERDEVDKRVQSLRDTWLRFRTIVENRVDLSTNFIKFLQLAEKLAEMFKYVEQILQSAPDDTKLSQLDELWMKIKSAYSQLNDDGNSFLDHISMVVDDTLDVRATRKCVEQILMDFSSRQIIITESWDNWTTIIQEGREIECVLQQIMSKNELLLISASKLDAQLYPILIKDTTDLKALKTFLYDKLHLFLVDIEKAQIEITHHIQTTAALKPKDDKTIDKVTQVLRNLNAIVDKLASIKNEFHSLVDSIVDYLENLITTKNAIELHFNEMPLVAKDLNEIEQTLAANEQFGQKIRMEINRLAEHQVRLVEQINKQEPNETKQHDVEYVKGLLCAIQELFESENAAFVNQLKVDRDIHKFKFDIKIIFDEMDQLKNRTNWAHEQLKEALITGCTGLLKCESFEQPIQKMFLSGCDNLMQHLDQQIDGFISASENVCNNNNDAAPFIQNSIGDLKRYWSDVKRQSNDLMQSIENFKQYSSVNEQIDHYYREHRNYLKAITNQINMAKHPNEAIELINQIDQYISNNESRQLELLKDLATLSKNVYGFDKTIEKYSENIELFQSFFTTKYQLNTIYEQLIEEVKIKAENEKFATTFPQVKIIETEQRLSLDEPSAYVPQQQMHHHQTIDMKIIESKQKIVMDEPPRFVEKLCNVQIQEGERCMLMCKVYSSQPIVEVKWFRNGLPISENNKEYLARYDNNLCTLSVDEKYTDDKSVAFTCRISNHLGNDETTSHLTILKPELTEVLFPPKFQEMLTTLNATKGSSITWKCFVDGNPLPNVQWYKNDECIDILPQYNFTYNNGEAILRMDDLSNNDAGLFTCVAKNMLGVDQCSASLIVTDVLQSIDSHTTNAESDVIEQKSGRPSFRTPLVDVITNVGQPIELTCTLIGDPEPNVIWKLNGHQFFSSDRIILKHDYERVKLLIKEAQSFDTGTYTLCAKNNAGLAYTSCDVKVNNVPTIDCNFDIVIDSTAIKPTVTLPLQNVCAFEGKSIQLDCEIRGFPEPEVIWYHENKPIKESLDVQLLFRGDRCSLLIQEAFMEDMGEYKVVAINSAGETSSRCDLTVMPNSEADHAKRSVETTTASDVVDGFEPRFEKLLSDVLANEGDTIELDCIVLCKPMPVIKWFLSNNQIEENDRIRFVHNEENGNAKLIFNKVANEDKGVYTIHVSNRFGEAKCFSHLNVKSVNAAENIAVKVNEDEEKNHFLNFKERFTNRTAHVGDTVKFECIVVGKPTPKIRWFFNDKPVQGKNFLPSISGERQVLTIPATTSETFGKISCLAENEFGREVCDAVLTLADQLPQSAEESEEYTEEYNTGSSNVTIKKQSAITTKTSEIRSYQTENGVPIILKSIEQPIDSLMGSGTSHLTEIKKNTLAQSNFIRSTDNIIMKSQKKNSAPRFILPLIGKIVKQGSSTTLEAIIDGFPTPDIVLLKNDLPLVENDNSKVLRQQNRIFITLENISIPDAGRYSCSATNSMGNAVSTADVVVKKTMFPPVFGHRLQAKVAKLGERVVMDIEVSGIPDPIVTWHKDDKPLIEAIISKHKIQSIGNSHTLVIEKACEQDAGKYMVKAVNDAGEAHGIADFIILEPTPDGMTEIVKTVAPENIEGQTNQFMSSTNSKVSINAESSYSLVDGVIPSPVYRPSSVKFKEAENEAKIKPIWHPSYESDSDVPNNKPIKPNLTPTGRSSTYSVGASPSPLNEQPLKFSSTSEQFHERDYQVLKPKPIAAFPNYKAKPSFGNLTQYYTATAGPPYHNQKNVSSETSRHMEMRESTKCSQHIVNMSSSTKRIVQHDQNELQQQQQHHERQEHQNDSFEKQLEAFPFKVSPNVSSVRHKTMPPPQTPTKFKPADCRESDYDSEIESFRIRSVWTPNQTESQNKHFRHVAAPTPNRCASATKHNNFQRILTPMDFDSGPVEMPTKIQTLSTPSPCFNSSPNQFKTQTLDRFRSKKKSNSHLKATSQDDLSIVHSTLKYSRLQSPSLAFNAEKKSTEYEHVRDAAKPQRVNYSIIGTSPCQERLPKYAPIFIAPLKDIAVINGHTARFECIVQCDPHPFVEWYRNDEPIRNGYGKHMVEFRNGVCRLTIPETVLSDSGIYSCTGTNHVGSVVTSAELVVNTENWGIRKQ